MKKRNNKLTFFIITSISLGITLAIYLNKNKTLTTGPFLTPNKKTFSRPPQTRSETKKASIENKAAIKKMKSYSRKIKNYDFKQKGRSYIFTGEIKENKLLIQDINSKKKGLMTGAVIVRLSDQNYLGDILKSHHLKLIKNFSHLDLYYLSTKSIHSFKGTIPALLKDQKLKTIEFEILSRPIKIK